MRLGCVYEDLGVRLLITAAGMQARDGGVSLPSEVAQMMAEVATAWCPYGRSPGGRRESHCRAYHCTALCRGQILVAPASGQPLRDDRLKATCQRTRTSRLAVRHPDGSLCNILLLPTHCTALSSHRHPRRRPAGGDVPHRA